MTRIFRAKWPFTVRLGLALLLTGLLPLATSFVVYQRAVHGQLEKGRRELSDSCVQLARELDDELAKMEDSARQIAERAAVLMNSEADEAVSDKLVESLEDQLGQLDYGWETIPADEHSSEDREFFGRRMTTAPDNGNAESDGHPSVSNVFVNRLAFEGLNDQEMRAKYCRIYADILATHDLDRHFKAVKLPLVQWAPKERERRLPPRLATSWLYLTTDDGMMRLFPYLENKTQFASWRPETMPYVRNAIDSEGAIWTPAYWDTAGHGFMVTYSHPVKEANDDTFRAVVSYDVTLPEIGRFLESSLPYPRKNGTNLFLLDSEGGILLFEGFNYSDSRPADSHPDDPMRNAADVMHWIQQKQRWLHGPMDKLVHGKQHPEAQSWLVTDIRDDEQNVWNLACEAVPHTKWRLGILRSNDSLAAVEDLRTITLMAVLFGGSVVVLVGVSLAAVMSRSLRRLNSILAASDHSSNDFVTRLSAFASESDRDISRVAKSIEDHARRERRIARDLNLLVRNVRHEVRQPLVSIFEAERLGRYMRNIVESARKARRTVPSDERGDLGLSDDDFEGLATEIDDIIEGMESAGERINDCMEMLRDDSGDPPTPGLCDLGVCLRRAVRWAATDYPGLEKVVRMNCCVDEPVSCYQVRLTRALSNLFTNSGEALRRRHGPLKRGWVTADVTADASDIRIVIEDDGVGIPSEHREHVFERGFTTSEGEGERGYGLCVVRDIIQTLHKGTVTIESPPQGGTRVTVTIPTHRRSFSTRESR